MDGGAWWATVHGVAQTRLSDLTFTSLCLNPVVLLPVYTFVMLHVWIRKKDPIHFENLPAYVR